MINEMIKFMRPSIIYPSCNYEERSNVAIKVRVFQRFR
jgi:hypothetical protein